MHLEEKKKERNIIVVNWCCILVLLGIQWMMPKGINNRLILARTIWSTSGILKSEG